MAQITGAQIHTALASQLKMDETSLPPSWDDLCSRGATYANGAIIGTLLSRGFRLDEEILLWDRYTEFAADLGVWKAMMLGGGYGSFDAKALNALDRHEELKTVYVFVGETLVEPPMGAPGVTASGGPLQNDPNSVFPWDPGDPIDQGFRW